MSLCFKCSKDIEPQDSEYGLHRACFVEWFHLKDASFEFEDIILKKDINNPKLPMNTSFFQGKFKKYSAMLDKHAYILKVQDENYPELPLVEYLSNQIAQKMGLTVPNFYLIRFPNELDAKSAFVVHNFMEAYTPGNLIHIYHFIGKHSFSCKTIFNIIENKVGRLNALKQVTFLCLFDALIGNHDRHGRNIALVETKKGYELAPFYDNPSYIGIEDQSLLLVNHNPRGTIATSRTEEPTMRDYVIEFIEMGHKSWVEEFLKRLEKTSIGQLIEKGFFSEKRKKAFSSLVDSRIGELKNACS